MAGGREGLGVAAAEPALTLLAPAPALELLADPAACERFGPLGDEPLLAIDLGAGAGPEAVAPARREAALAAGAGGAFDPREPGAVRRIVKETGGAAAVVDFVGSGETARFGFDILRKGGRLIVVGLFGGGLTVPVPHFPLREVAIMGSYVGSLQDLRDLLALAVAGRAGRPAVATHRLDEAERLLCGLQAGEITGRAVLVP